VVREHHVQLGGSLGRPAELSRPPAAVLRHLSFCHKVCGLMTANRVRVENMRKQHVHLDGDLSKAVTWRRPVTRITLFLPQREWVSKAPETETEPRSGFCHTAHEFGGCDFRKGICREESADGKSIQSSWAGTPE
jgi:hypothetical protein